MRTCTRLQTIKETVYRDNLEELPNSVVDPDPHESALICLSWIRNHIGNTDPDPGAWKLTKIYKYVNLVGCLSNSLFYLRRYIILPITPVPDSSIVFM